MSGIEIFNDIINTRLIENRRFLSGRSASLPAFTAIAGNLGRKRMIRSGLLKSEGITVPPILIISVTNECNLSCKGCYSLAQERCRDEELSISEIDRIVGEAVDAGVGIIFLAGGEPLMKKGLLNIPRKYRDTLFVMFTNGFLIDDSRILELKRIRNLVPAFSLEGNEASTDARRGSGVFRKVRQVMKTLDAGKLLFGTSITLTRNNYEEVMEEDFLDSLESSGCRTLFLIEYVPCEGDPELCLTEEQKADLLLRLPEIQKQYRMLPVALPGDEEKFGGCLAAGRGFLHISSEGRIEACPFAPFSDVNLKTCSFLEGLQSRLLSKIRDNHHLLEEAEGGCTLFENSRWVEELLQPESTSVS